MTIEVTLKMTTWLMFEVTKETDPFQAARSAVRAVEDGDQPDDYPMMPDLEVYEVKVGDREINLYTHLNFSGPRGEDGLTPYIFVAYENCKRLAEASSLEGVLAAVFPKDGDGDG